MTRGMWSVFASCLLLMPAVVKAQTASDQSTTIVCGSKSGERQTCDAHTSGGVTLVKPLGTAACELGRVGALSLPYSVGSNGGVFRTNFMVWF